MKLDSTELNVIGLNSTFGSVFVVHLSSQNVPKTHLIETTER